MNQSYDINSKDVLLFVTSMGFDLSCYDIFGILAAGGKPRPQGLQKDPKGSKRSLELRLRVAAPSLQEGITFWDSAPAVLQLLEPELSKAPTLRTIFLSGDWVPLSLAPW